MMTISVYVWCSMHLPLCRCLYVYLVLFKSICVNLGEFVGICMFVHMLRRLGEFVYRLGEFVHMVDTVSVNLCIYQDNFCNH